MLHTWQAHALPVGSNKQCNPLLSASAAEKQNISSKHELFNTLLSSTSDAFDARCCTAAQT
jgi:hypothetical protein